MSSFKQRIMVGLVGAIGFQVTAWGLRLQTDMSILPAVVIGALAGLLLGLCFTRLMGWPMQ